jgi:predicted RNA polymerase sigma factor
MERVRLIAGLARHVGDLTLAEDLAQEALVAALATWPRIGTPPNPGAWLMTTAKRRAVDLWRRRRMMTRHEATLAHDIETAHVDDFEAVEATLDDGIGDERLSLIFTACHPLLSRDQRTALTLKVIGGRRRCCGRVTSPSRCRLERNAMRASPRCWRSSTLFSTRAMPQAGATI